MVWPHPHMASLPVNIKDLEHLTEFNLLQNHLCTQNLFATQTLDLLEKLALHSLLKRKLSLKINVKTVKTVKTFKSHQHDRKRKSFKLLWSCASKYTGKTHSQHSK